jgi:hypothetical protein
MRVVMRVIVQPFAGDVLLRIARASLPMRASTSGNSAEPLLNFGFFALVSTPGSRPVSMTIFGVVRCRIIAMEESLSAGVRTILAENSHVRFRVHVSGADTNLAAASDTVDASAGSGRRKR